MSSATLSRSRARLRAARVASDSLTADLNTFDREISFIRRLPWVGNRLSADTKKTEIVEQRSGTHGLFRYGAFGAARIRRPSLQYSGVVLPPGPNSWLLNI